MQTLGFKHYELTNHIVLFGGVGRESDEVKEVANRITNEISGTGTDKKKDQSPNINNYEKDR